MGATEAEAGFAERRPKNFGTANSARTTSAPTRAGTRRRDPEAGLSLLSGASRESAGSFGTGILAGGADCTGASGADMAAGLATIAPAAAEAARSGLGFRCAAIFATDQRRLGSRRRERRAISRN